MIQAIYEQHGILTEAEISKRELSTLITRKFIKPRGLRAQLTQQLAIRVNVHLTKEVYSYAYGDTDAKPAFLYAPDPKMPLSVKKARRPNMPTGKTSRPRLSQSLEFGHRSMTHLLDKMTKVQPDWDVLIGAGTHPDPISWRPAGGGQVFTFM